MDLRLLTLANLFDAKGNMLVQCCQRHKPGPHESLNGHDIPVDERQGILESVNNAPWRIADADDAYCPFCVLAMGG
jgi:hypothetical protein